MIQRDDFGALLGRRLHADHLPAIAVRAIPGAEMAVTEIRADRPTFERSDPLPGADAYVAILQLRDYPRHEWWEEGRRAPLASLRAGELTLCDLRRDPRFALNAPFHSVHVRIPSSAIAELRREWGVRGSGDLRRDPGEGVNDPAFRHLAAALRPALERPAEWSPLFVDGVTLAIAGHLAARYGLPAAAPRIRGALAPAQLARALERIDAALDGQLRIADLARHCGLSPSHFVQAFRRATGTTPHRWLSLRRIERARRLLRETDLPLARLALACGFADQSHFTRVFTARTGTPPGAWRRR
jgi:AraC-like DNA-binding protein